jgi:hypothetical protein
MGFEFDFSQTPDDPTRIQDGFGGRVGPGKGMALITEWEDYGMFDRKAHKLGLEIVAWTAKEELGKVHEEAIFHKDSTGKGFPMRRMTCLAMAAGLFTAVDVKRWKDEKKNPEIDMAKLVGRPIMIELVEEPRQNDPTKKDIKIGNIGLAFYHIKDKRIEAWPKNLNIFNANAHIVGEWITETKPAAKPATPHPDTSTADPFGALG